MKRLKNWLRSIGMSRTQLRWLRLRGIASEWILKPYLRQEQRKAIVQSGDPVRYGTILLCLERLAKEKIPGAMAECGVYKGTLSKFLHSTCPDRTLFLFDTFEGFDERDLHTGTDNRFKDTSVEQVLQTIGDLNNIVVRKGLFQNSLAGLEGEKFAFVMIDFDKYEPTLAALEFFYWRTSKGGFIFVHDYNSPESDWACSKALNEFMADLPEKLVPIADSWGSALFRKA